MKYPVLHPPTKRLRADVIYQHLVAAEAPRKVVVFTCGHAADALRDASLDVLEVGPAAHLRTTRWWSYSDVRRVWPDRFDATPGHLPVPLLLQLADRLHTHLGPLGYGAYMVPSGSGETIMALRLAYPHTTFIPLTSEHPAINWQDLPRSLYFRVRGHADAWYEPGYDPTKERTP